MALLRIRKLKLQIASFTDLWWISFEWIPSLSREPLFPLVYCQTGLFYLLLFLVPCSLIFIEVSSPPLCGELYVFNSLAALLSLNFIVISVFKLVFPVLEDFLSFPLIIYLLLIVLLLRKNQNLSWIAYLLPCLLQMFHLP